MKLPTPALTPETASDVPAVDRTLDILEHLSTRAEGLTLSEISAELKLPKNAVFRITAALQSRGYLAREESSKRFSITGRFLQLSQPRGSRVPLAEAAIAPMRELRDATRETVQLGVQNGLEGVILQQLESLHPLRISVDLGLRFPLYNNAPGKLLLAHMTDSERDRALRTIDLAPSTARTLTDPEKLRQECRRIRDQGFSVDHAEADEGIHCVAAPVLNPLGQLEAALWISAPSRRLPKDQFAMAAQSVMKAARGISDRMNQ
jgi:IclR family transcriptional regulator, KDG regulon repressor